MELRTELRRAGAQLVDRVTQYSKSRIADVKNLSWWTVMGVGLISASLAGCGGGSGSDSGNLRVINATLTHASLDVIKASDSSKLLSATALDTVSASVGVSSSGDTLQITDAGNTTALATVAPSVAGGQHSAMVVYESSGAVKAAFLGEDFTVPAAGTAFLKVFFAAPDAGSLDVYVVASTADITSATPVSFGTTSAAALSTQPTQFTPGTYRVRVTGQGSKTDIRLDIPSITLTSATVNTLILTPTAGGVLVNGSTLVQQAATYAASRNTNARVRVVAGIPGNVPVSATVGTTPVSIAQGSPSVGSYVVVPAASTALSYTVGSNAAITTALPATTLAVGTDTTLLLTGAAATPTLTTIADDNHLPTTSTSAKVRLVNGMSGSGSATMQVNLVAVANGIGYPGASAYTSLTANLLTTVNLSASGISPAPAPLTSQPVGGNGVYTLYMLGDATSADTRTYFLQSDR
ncbi:hypothetical protein BH11PSE8_BH11PSE8_34290 [soil metagenome]